jgi:hypothetical protein
VHQFLKRRGAHVEDMDGGPRMFEVILQFITDDLSTAAQKYDDFDTRVSADPYGLLIHPTAGRWQAFCTGPNHNVSFARALNQIEIRVSFIETDGATPPAPDVPAPSSAAQNVTNQISAFQVAVAQFMGAVAKGQVFVESTQAAIDKALENIDTLGAALETPLELMQSTIATGFGVTSDLIRRVNSVVSKSNIFAETCQDYVTLALSNTLFTGPTAAPVALDGVDTLLGNVAATGRDLEDALDALAITPAGAADAFGGVEDTVASCIVLSDALAASRPPVIAYRVPAVIDLLTLCQLRYKKNAAARAQDILSLNRISNPAAIPSGTVLRIPSE